MKLHHGKCWRWSGTLRHNHHDIWLLHEITLTYSIVFQWQEGNCVRFILTLMHFFNFNSFQFILTFGRFKTTLVKMLIHLILTCHVIDVSERSQQDWASVPEAFHSVLNEKRWRNEQNWEREPGSETCGKIKSASVATDAKLLLLLPSCSLFTSALGVVTADYPVTSEP